MEVLGGIKPEAHLHLQPPVPSEANSYLIIMQTRSRRTLHCHSTTTTTTTTTRGAGDMCQVLVLSNKRKKQEDVGGVFKRIRRNAVRGSRLDSGFCRSESWFDSVPDDLIVEILACLSSRASRPKDLFNAVLTCKKLRNLVFLRPVLAKASLEALSVRAQRWSDSAHAFLKSCCDAGNLEACYVLGMIRFYCLQIRPAGAALLARAAMGFHSAALYSLAVIQFNGSGGTKSEKDLRAGVALCARAASLGHIDALRDLGHCLQDGYGVRQNVPEGRRYLLQANARELAGFVLAAANPTTVPAKYRCSLLSDFGCHLPKPELHPVNKFMLEWFGSKGPITEGLGLCSNGGCGRPETRKHEFRRCSVCGAVNYCSRACQALDWKIRHKAQCGPTARWINAGE